MKLIMWLYPGLRVKRWFLLSFLGMALAGAGVVVILNALPISSLRILLISLLLRWGREVTVYGGLAMVAGGALISFLGFERMMKSIVRALLPMNEERLVEMLYQKRHLERGPRLVAIGGGTGLAVLLRGLKAYTSNLTALVTVSDDGGSSGRLRGQLGILPPGDIRNCLVALADTESLMEELVSYRFGKGEDLAGHSMGNLLLAALSDITGNLDLAIREVSKVLAIRGRVLPSTLTDVALVAELADGRQVEGESSISRSGRIKRVRLNPERCLPLEEALRAIGEAEAIVLGPGSLYTSVIPNLLVEGITEALRRARAPVFYVLNIMTQPGETDGYTASDHLKAIEEHCGPGLVDYVVVNVAPVPQALRQKYKTMASFPVVFDTPGLKRTGVEVIRARLLDGSGFVRHDSGLLARTLLSALFRQQRL